VEQGLLRDKEEVRELQRKMTETGSTIELAKVEIEKARKEAKQQKGLLAIAKKQLASREAERVKLAQELQEATAEAGEATKEREIVEAELSREVIITNTANGHSFAPSPSLSADSVTSPAQPLPGTPGSPSSVSGSTAGKSNNPFERLGAGSGSQSPFLPFANASVPTPPAVTSARNEGTTTDNPFTFDQAFGGEEARPGPDVQEQSTAPEGNGQPFTAKAGASELRAGANEEVSEPSSDHDLFMTPPTSALDGLGIGNTLTAEPAVQNLFPLGTPSAAPSTDRPSEAYTDINTKLKDLDVNESDSSDDDSEDETPLATLVGRTPHGSNSNEAVKEAPVSNGDASAQTTVETAFPPLTGAVATAEVQSTNPFPPPAKDSSPFPTSTSPFAASSAATPKAASVSDFDKVFGDVPGTAPAAAGNNLSFDNAFEDQFDFDKADVTASLPTEGTSSASSSTFPPPPTSTSGSMKPLATVARDSGFENAFSPQQSTAGPARPDGLPVLPPVPESKPFSVESAFETGLPAVPPPGVTTQPASNQPPFNPPAASPSLDDAFGVDSTQQGSAFGAVSSRSSSIPQGMQSPVSARASGSPVRGTISPREAVNFPVPPPPGPPPLTSPPLPPRGASPKGKPSMSKESGREQVRSKLSVSELVHYCLGVE
jgi:epidermal growth factor receptor substrate 15